jgi:hypothetical protein
VAAAAELKVTRRYLTATTSERSVALAVVAVIGIGFIALIVYMYVDTRGAPPEVLLLTAPGLALLGGAAYFWLSKRDSVRVDLGTRTAMFARAGKPVWTARLDEIGPIAIVVVKRELFRSGRSYWRTEYRVVANSVPLYAKWSYRQARRAGDRLARQWKVGLRPLDGHVRQCSELDQSLAAAQLAQFNPRQTTEPLGPETGTTLEEKPEQAFLRSTKGLQGGEAPNILWLGAAGMAGLAASERHVVITLSDPAAGPLETLLVSVLVLATLAALGRFLYEAWRAVLPAEVQIDPRSVAYRGRSVATAQVVEVVSADAICVCTPRRTLEIPHGFCEPQFDARVVEELRRVVAEKGQRR